MMKERVACNHCGSQRDQAVTLVCGTCGQRSWHTVDRTRGDLVTEDVIEAAQAMNYALLCGDTITKQHPHAQRLAEACREYVRDDRGTGHGR
jgi:hypothetical protein